MEEASMICTDYWKVCVMPILPYNDIASNRELNIGITPLDVIPPHLRKKRIALPGFIKPPLRGSTDINIHPQVSPWTTAGEVHAMDAPRFDHNAFYFPTLSRHRRYPFVMTLNCIKQAQENYNQTINTVFTWI